jgi:hypothetical protein
MSEGRQTVRMKKLGMEGHRKKDFAFVLELEGAGKMQHMAETANTRATAGV